MRNGNNHRTAKTQRNLFQVLTVPMRNGNKMKEKELLNMKKVLTVPMRNGNYRKIIDRITVYPFLPYL